MVPVIAGMGTSFKGAFLYYCHDKDALTDARVAWTATLNLMADTAEKAWRFMAYTAQSHDRLKQAACVKNTGRILEKPVFTYSLSWHPEQSPTRREMMQAAKESLKRLGLEEHQTLIACHHDEPQPHIHMIVNRVHPLTGIAAKLSRSKRKLSDFARLFQRREGTDYCPAREDNHRKRQRGQQTKHGDPVIVKAWEASQNGRDFMTALQTEGYQLAQGNKRLVVVERYGKAINPVRHLPDVKTKHFNARLSDLDLTALPDAATLQAQHKQTENQKRNAEKQQQEALAEQHAIRLADLQNQHLEERAQLYTSHHTRIEKAKTELADYYGLADQKANIRSLNTKLKKVGFFGKLLGRHKKICSERDNLILTLRDAQTRYHEAISTLEHKRDRDLKILTNRQKQAVKRLKNRLQEQAFPQQSKEQHRHRSYQQSSRGFQL